MRGVGNKTWCSGTVAVVVICNTCERFPMTVHSRSLPPVTSLPTKKNYCTTIILSYKSKNKILVLHFLQRSKKQIAPPPRSALHPPILCPPTQLLPLHLPLLPPLLEFTIALPLPPLLPLPILPSLNLSPPSFTPQPAHLKANLNCNQDDNHPLE